MRFRYSVVNPKLNVLNISVNIYCFTHFLWLSWVVLAQSLKRLQSLCEAGAWPGPQDSSQGGTLTWLFDRSPSVPIDEELSVGLFESLIA